MIDVSLDLILYCLRTFSMNVFSIESKLKVCHDSMAMADILKVNACFESSGQDNLISIQYVGSAKYGSTEMSCRNFLLSLKNQDMLDRYKYNS